MAWIMAAIGAHFLWALTNIGDKCLIGNKISNPYIYSVWFALVGGLSLLFIPFCNWSLVSGPVLGWIVISGGLFFLGNILFYRALSFEEVSRVNIWWSLIPFFSLLLNALTLREPLNGLQTMAILILMTASFLGSVQSRGKKMSFSKAFGLMIGATLAIAGYGVTFHYATAFVPFGTVFIGINGTMLVLALLWLLVSGNFRREFILQTKQFSPAFFGLLIVVNVVDKGATLVHAFALSLQSSALVFAMEATQALFVFGIATVIARYKPAFMNEQTDRKNLLIKFMAVILSASGIVILALV